MSENMRLWNSVEKTNPAHTKKVSLGRTFTAIDPYHQIRKATEAFGPAGQGWGWSVVEHVETSTANIAILVRLWHGSRDNSIEQWGQAGLFIDKAHEKPDHDCFKKATTDAVTKCLSYLGFNADVFLGRFDDNKYVQQRAEEEKISERLAAHKRAVAENEESVKAFQDAIACDDYEKAVEAWFEISCGKGDECLKCEQCENRYNAQMAIYGVAPKDGGTLSTKERAATKSTAWKEAREAFFGKTTA